jgi:ribose 1,5-bisphosphate isomerase
MIPSDIVKRALASIEGRMVIGATQVAITCLNAIANASMFSTAKTSEDFLVELSNIFTEVLKSSACVRTYAPILLLNGFRSLIHEVKTGVENGLGVDELKKLVSLTVNNFIKALKTSIDKIGELGSRYILDGDTVLTHESSTTVLSILARASQSGRRFEVIVTETRPEFYGRTLAMALADLNIPVTLIIDSAHYKVMKRVSKVFLGAIAISPGGETLSKIGSAPIAHIAHENGIKVYVAANTHKFTADFTVLEELSQRDGEASMVFSEEEAKRLGIKVLNPLYDIIPPRDIDYIVTEKGAVPPQGAVLIAKENYGWPLVGLKLEDLT